MSFLVSRESPDTKDASALIAELQAELEPLYAAKSRHGYSVEKLLQTGVAFFVAREDGVPAGCGGIQLFGTEYGELKRMYVRPAHRGRGCAKAVFDALAGHARSNGVTLLRLETGIYQTAAIAFYEREGFRQIPPFGPYWDDPVSRCYELRLP
ncbi:MAG TPA: GNAT family N-acetyltransferase [Gemmatimonadaceae bacterium]|nr:GNAT family N-acetyltransferase [Gemmatimonadaceae bacterium]